MDARRLQIIIHKMKALVHNTLWLKLGQRIASSLAVVMSHGGSLPASVPELAALQSKLRLKDRECNNQARRLKRQRVKQDHRSAQAEHNIIDIAVVILAVAAPDLTCVPEFLTQWKKSSQPDIDDFMDNICKKYVALTDVELSERLDPHSQRSKSLLRQAEAFATKFRLHVWVEKMNQQKGIAPSISDALQQRQEFTTALELSRTDLSQNSKYSTRAAAGYKWVRRFKRKWRLRSHQAGAREHVPLEDARKKVSHVTNH